MTDPQTIAAAPAHLQLRVLSDADVVRVHEAALELLGSIAAVAAAAPAQVPDTMVLGGRVFEHHSVLGAHHAWLATGGPAERVRPLKGGEPQLATGADLEAACRLADALPEVAVVYGPPVHAAGETPLQELARCFAATSKHIQLTTLRGAAEASAAVKMALAVAGGEVQLRARPPISLSGGADALGAATVFAHAGLPVGIVASPASFGARPAGDGGAALPVDDGGSATPPATPPARSADLATILVEHHAGVLAACATVQTLAPGAPFFYVAHPSAAGLPAAGPEATLFQIAAVQLAEYVGLPASAAGMGTASHEPDWQACSQNAQGSLAAAAGRADLVVGAGTLGGGAVFSLQQLVLDSEIFSWNAYMVGGIPVDEGAIALDTIKKVGIGGNYLAQRHTREYRKGVWRPRLLDRSMWDAWVAGGREGAYEKATELAGRLLAEHEVMPLGDELSGMVERISANSGL